MAAAGTFYCHECNTGYFQNTAKTCTVVTTVTNCKTYHSTSDACSVCNDNFFKKSTANECYPFPTGIYKCEMFTDSNTCSVCLPDFYLENNSCVEVSTKLANCKYYTNSTTCKSCASNFIIVSGTCTAVEAVNCVTWKDTKNCETCGSRKGIKEVSGKPGVFDCTSITDANCKVNDIKGTFPCLQCEGTYYPNSSGLCTAATSIAGCSIYKTATTCKTCLINYVLLADGKCTNDSNYLAYVSPKCRNNVMLSAPLCSFCGEGYYHGGSNCTACKNNTFSSGCGACDPFDLTKCLYCR